MKIKKLTKQDIKITIEVLPEDLPVRGNAIISGNDEEDKEVEDTIIADLKNGNEWAWCSIRVKCTYMGLAATDYLGAGSYKSKEDFMHNDYYQQMIFNCIKDLQNQVEALIKKSTTK